MEALIVHYNTPELTAATVASVRKHSPKIKITIYDSSNNYRGDADFIIRNRIDFDAFLAKYQDKKPTCNGYGSAKHCYTVDCLMYGFKNGFFLMDSDILLKKDISPLWQPDKIWVGQPHVTKRHEVNIPRLYPFLCYINSPLCIKNGIHYFNGDYMWELNQHPINSWYDTGAYFLEATKGLPGEVVNINDYMLHYGGGSFLKDKPVSPAEWLEQNSNLYK